MLRAGGPDWQSVLGYVESIYRHFEMWQSEQAEAKGRRLNGKTEEVPMQGTRTPTATVQERNCITTFVHYCLFLFNLSLHRLLLCTYFYSCVSLLWSGLHENCVDCGYSAEACYPVDLDFTCQIFHRTLLKRNLFIVLEIYGINSLFFRKTANISFCEHLCVGTDTAQVL